MTFDRRFVGARRPTQVSSIVLDVTDQECRIGTIRGTRNIRYLAPQSHRLGLASLPIPRTPGEEQRFRAQPVGVPWRTAFGSFEPRRENPPHIVVSTAGEPRLGEGQPGCRAFRFRRPLQGLLQQLDRARRATGGQVGLGDESQGRQGGIEGQVRLSDRGIRPPKLQRLPRRTRGGGRVTARKECGNEPATREEGRTAGRKRIGQRESARRVPGRKGRTGNLEPDRVARKRLHPGQFV